VITATTVGHQLKAIDLFIRSDTTLTIVLSRRTISLDTVLVRPRNLRIKGTAVDSTSGDFLLQAQATLYPGGRFVGATSGVFTFDSVSPGLTTLVVEGHEHLPMRVELDLQHDTTFRIRLGIDSLAVRMTAMQVRRLEQRSRAIPMPTTALNREAIEREGATSLLELVTHRLYQDPGAVRKSFVKPPASTCYFVDDSRVPLAVLEGMQPQLVERIEIYRSGGPPSPSLSGGTGRNFGPANMVRVYTRRYVSTLARQKSLPRVFYVGTGLSPSCS
jgi:hypothetical protein